MKLWDIQGLQYVFKITLFVIGIIGVSHTGIAAFRVTFPEIPAITLNVKNSLSNSVSDSITDSIGWLAKAEQIDRRSDGGVLIDQVTANVTSGVRAVSLAMSEVVQGVSDLSLKTIESMSAVTANAINAVVPDDSMSESVLILTPDTVSPPVVAEPVPSPIPKPKPVQAPEPAHTLVLSPTLPDQLQPNPVAAKTDENTLTVSADAYLVSDLKTGKTIIEHNSNVQHPIASISKLVTALTVRKLFTKDTLIKITKQAIDTPSEAGKLVEGETMSAQDLLYPMLIESSNDAAVAYQLQYDQGTKSPSFAESMNEFARGIGMKNSNFSEPSGLSPKNVSTAKDLLTLVQYIKANNPDIFAITRIEGLEMVASDKNVNHVFKNNNTFAKRKDFVGGKTGKTDEAKETMLSVFHVADKANPSIQSDIVITVLKSNNRIDDTNKIYTWYMEKFGKVAGSV